MKKTLFSVTFPDGSIFTLPKDWKDVFIAHFGTKKETYKELSDRIIFITGKYMENKAFPSKFDGLKWLAEEKTPDAAAYDDPDFYGESWEEWVIERREWERKTGNIPNPPTWADVAEGLIYQQLRGAILQKALRKMGSKTKVVTPEQFIREIEKDV